MKNLKVYINGRFLTQSLTGVQRFATELVSSLDATEIPPKWEIILLAPKGIISQPSLRQIELRVGGRLSGHLWEQFELPVLSCGGILVNLCNTGPILKRRQLVAIHDTAVFRYPKAFSLSFRVWYNILMRVLARSATKLLTVSEFSKNEILSLLNAKPNRVAVLLEGKEHILRTIPDTEILSRLGLEKRPFILTVSSMNPYKNFRAIRDALAYLSDLDFNLVVAGGSNPKVFNWMKEAFPKNLKSIGYVSDEELRALYNAASAFVFPSLYEGFGLPVLEAMACGCPVISSCRASLPEVCKNAAIYFNPENPWEIADKIRQILNDQLLADTLRRRGLERAQNFSWKKATRPLIKQIGEVIHA